MNRIIISITTGFIVFLGVLHSYTGGLLIQLERRVTYSNELVSSGSESSFIVLIGFLVFMLAFIGAVLKKAVLKTYFCCVLFLYLMLYLANLDVSLIDSIKLGDYILLLAILVVHALGIYHLTRPSI